MKYIFNDFYIRVNPILFYISAGIIVITIIGLFIAGIKVLRKK